MGRPSKHPGRPKGEAPLDKRRYRKIDPRIWHDEKFVTLSERDKLLVIYILTAQTNRIGIFRFSIAKAAEDLGCMAEIETFQSRIRNVCISFNWGWDNVAKTVFLPNWWRYNRPDNPNVLKSCLSDLQELPQTHLAEEFLNNTRHLPSKFCDKLAEFRETFLFLSPQEQEQEQEQDSRESMSTYSPLPAAEKRTEKQAVKNPHPKTAKQADPAVEKLPVPQPVNIPEPPHADILDDLIDRWNSLPDGIVGTRVRNRRSADLVKAWSKAIKTSGLCEILREPEPLIDAVSCARYCHGQGWFTFSFLLSCNEAGEFKAAKLLNGGYDHEQPKSRGPESGRFADRPRQPSGGRPKF